MLYTRKGDSGTSGLYGTKDRFPKDSDIYEALGSLDELNSLIGLARAYSQKIGKISIAETLRGIQECLFVIQAEVARAGKVLSAPRVRELEHEIDTIEGSIHNPHAFVIPGTTEFSALCDYARAVTRRVERRVTTVASSEAVGEHSLAYLNRLSSYFYALARQAAGEVSLAEPNPSY